MDDTTIVIITAAATALIFCPASYKAGVREGVAACERLLDRKLEEWKNL